MRVTVDLERKHKVRGPLRYADSDFSNYTISTEQDEKRVSIIVRPKGGPVTGVIMETD